MKTGDGVLIPHFSHSLKAVPPLMILLALMLAHSLKAVLPTPARVVLVDGLVRVPASRWSVIDVLLKQRGAVVECRYSVERGRSGVRVALMSVADAERFQAGRSHRPLVSLPYERAGFFRHPVTKPGEYRLVIDNRMEGRGPALVRVQLAAVFGDPMLEIRELPAGRRANVVMVSLGLFALVALWAAWRLRRASRRPRAEHD
jgi:hypothetical protein